MRVSLVKGTTGAGSTRGTTALALALALLANGDRVLAVVDAVTDVVQAVSAIVGGN